MSKEITFKELFISVFIFFRKNFKILLIAVVIGVTLGIVKHFLGEPVYKSNMTVFAHIEDERDYENIQKRFSFFYSGELIVNKINSFKSALESNNVEYLSKELNISKDSLKMLKNLEIEFLFPVEGTENEKEIREIDYFKITAEVINNDILPKLEKGLHNSIVNDPFIAQKVENTKKTTSDLIKEIDKEILKLEEAQKLQLKQGKNTNFFITNKSLYSEKIDLIAKKMKFNKKLNQYNPFQIVTNFVPSNKNKNSLIKNAVILGFVFFIIALIGIVIRDLWILAREYEQNN